MSVRSGGGEQFVSRNNINSSQLESMKETEEDSRIIGTGVVGGERERASMCSGQS